MGSRRWYDIPLTAAESVAAERELTVFLGRDTIQLSVLSTAVRLTPPLPPQLSVPLQLNLTDSWKLRRESRIITRRALFSWPCSWDLPRARRCRLASTTWRQELTLVHFSAQREHNFVGYVGCMISPQSIRQGDTERCDQMA